MRGRMRRFGYPIAPFVLCLMLGDILDKNLRPGLVLSDGDFLPFLARPISAILTLLVLYTPCPTCPPTAPPALGFAAG